jgi:signal transduction histidine kinase
MVADVLSDPEYTYWDAQRLSNFRSLLNVPLLRDGEVIGVMGMWRTEPRAFTEQQAQLVSTFADQAVIAIESARSFTETKEALEQQQAVGEVLQVISRSAFDLRHVLDTLADSAARLCEAEDVVINRVIDGQLDIATHRGSVPLPLTSRFPIAPGFLSGRAVLERRPIHVLDAMSSEDFPGARALARETGQRTCLAVPLLREGAAVGAILLRRLEVRPFTERQIKLLETFADQAVIAIENVRLFNEIQDKSRQLEVASRHKSEFLANMSHELRTPLNAIIGFTDVMLEEMFGPLNEKQKEYLDDVRGSGTHLLTLINDILDLSKIEAGRVELEITEFSFPDALENALTLVRERAARHGITIAPEMSAGVGAIAADERKVKQILVNLLSNAVKFTPDGGWVGVTVRRADGQVQVAVRDTGIGIAPEDQDRIFEEFQQVGRDPDKSREGTGLGLTLAKRFVELHGGRIWVESEVGKGSTFTFAIPVRQTAMAEARG